MLESPASQPVSQPTSQPASQPANQPQTKCPAKLEGLRATIVLSIEISNRNLTNNIVISIPIRTLEPRTIQITQLQFKVTPMSHVAYLAVGALYYLLLCLFDMLLSCIGLGERARLL